jgi:signal transduction histidine kinase
MSALGTAAAGEPRTGAGTTAPYEALGNALHRLTRVLDEVLLADREVRREELRMLRLLSTDALHAMGPVVEGLHGRRGDGSVEAALRAIAAEYAEATGAVVHVRVRGSVHGLGDEEGEAFRRVAREALGNVDRHARASVLLLALDVDDATTTLDIVDDGVGLAGRQVTEWGSSVDLGLRRMSRAMTAVGGTFSVHRLRPRGLRLHAVVPRAARSGR